MKKIAGISALASGLLPLAVIVALSILTKDYMLFRDFISVLGVKEFSAVFNSTLVASSILIIPFGIYMHKTAKKIYIAALFAVVIASLAGIGIFPMSAGPWHWMFSSMFFLFVFTLILAIGLKTTLGHFSKAALAIGTLGLFGDIIHLALDFNPAIEALQVFMITLWLVYAGIDSLKGEFGKD